MSRSYVIIYYIYIYLHIRSKIRLRQEQDGKKGTLETLLGPYVRVWCRGFGGSSGSKYKVHAEMAFLGGGGGRGDEYSCTNKGSAEQRPE